MKVRIITRPCRILPQHIVLLLTGVDRVQLADGLESLHIHETLYEDAFVMGDASKARNLASTNARHVV